ncbi:MAG: preprotein translocase subunit SecG [Pyrinomonadaceae bacterium]|nr:preprotein translocase subunit SecG [Pyrinomonadaceae bacterium]
MIYIFYGLFLVSCIILVVAVMLQPGKADAGSLFTSNISSTAFGPRGTQSVLAKITIGAAVSFMLVAFLLSQQAIVGTTSVLQRTTSQETTPAENTPNANVADTNNPTVAPSVDANNPTNPTTTPANAENTNGATTTTTPAK